MTTTIQNIPADWKVRKLGDMFRVTRGQVLSMQKVSEEKTSDYPYPVYSSQTSNNGLSGYYKDYLFEDCITWTTDGANAGDVKYRSGKFYCTNVCGVLISSEGYANRCVAEAFNRVSKTYVSYVGNPKLMNNVVSEIPIALPSSIKEQEAISGVLSDADEAIAKMEMLIEKKKNIRQATMQQLLTGKKRLPGFSEKWKTRTLGDEIEKLEAGISVNSVEDDLQVHADEKAILKTSCVSNGHFLPHECKTIAPRDLNRAKLNPRADSIIISRMNTPDLVGECGYVLMNYSNLYLPDRLWMMRFKRESRLIVRWLSYLLSHKEYKIKIKGTASGTSGSMKNIAKVSLLSIVIPFPAPDEQKAIAAVLTDMDAEITALEQRRDKTHAIKQGMMQELLTGKTRLI